MSIAWTKNDRKDQFIFIGGPYDQEIRYMKKDFTGFVVPWLMPDDEKSSQEDRIRWAVYKTGGGRQNGRKKVEFIDFWETNQYTEQAVKEVFG